MAARGSVSKEVIINTILDTFKDSFLCNGGKELRIPMEENGEIVQIKVALTCAKTNVENPNDERKQPQSNPVDYTQAVSSPVQDASEYMNEPTSEEKKLVADLVNRLGIK